MSHDDGLISFADAKAAGLAGIIHKATTGATGRDDAYGRRRQAALDAGLLWGAYHWGTAADVAAQLDNFFNCAAPDDTTLVALDYEQDVGDQMSLDQARAFCQGVFDKLARRPVIYSGVTAKAALGNSADAFFGAHRLWLPQYGNAPAVQRSWKTYWLWQYTDGVKGPGVKTVPGLPGNRQGALDCDHFAGTPDDLAAQWAS